MEETINQIISDLETYQNPNLETPISESTLLKLETLLDFTHKTKDPIDIELFFDELMAKNLSVASFVAPITSAMESGSTHLSILATKVYLSLLLAPSAPVFTLFTPIAFLSLLRSIRCCFKNPINRSGGNPVQKRKGRGGGRAGVSRFRAQNVSEEDQGENESGESSKLDVRVLFSVLERLELVLGLIHLDRFPDSLKSLVQTIAEIPVLALDFCGNSGSNYDRLCGFCSRILCEVLKREHGNLMITAAEVLKSLSPSVLLLRSQAHAFGLRFVVDKMMVMAKDSDEVKKAVVNFPKYMVNKAPDKSEPRVAAVESIIEIVRAMEYTDQVGFADYVIKMAQGAPRLRLLAVDLFLAMMMSLVDPFGVNSEGMNENSWGLRCLEALINRCSDSTAGTRARALTNLAQLVGYYSKSDRTRAIFKQVMALDNKDDSGQVRSVSKLLRERCVDEKAAVRKAALLLTSKLTGLVEGTFDGEVLKTMGMSCSDSLVSIRKAAVSSLSEVFRTFWDDDVTKEWLHSVPPLITDSESSIQEECENLFMELVLDRVSRAGTTHSPRRCNFNDSDGKKKNLEREEALLFPEGVLCLLREIGNGEVTPWVKKICASLGKKKQLKPKIAIALQSIIRTSESLWLSHSMPIEKWTAPAGAWLLLSEVSAFLPKSVDWEFLHHHWQLLDKHEQGGESKGLFEQELDEGADGIESSSVAWAGDRVFLLETISNVSIELPPEPAADLAHNLLQRIEDFNMHTTEVNAHLKALKTLCTQKAIDAEEVDSLVKKWVYLVLSKASKILETYMSNDLEANEDSRFITPPTRSRKSKRAPATMSRLLSQTICAVHTIGSLVIIYPSVELNHVLPILHKVITSGSSDPKVNKLPGPTLSIKQMAPALYIQAWVTLGKICLADEKLAKRYIPLFVEELDTSDSAALRNNIVVVMTDCCVQYTALVDSYISKITKCLRDPCEVVRRQTFILLARLLQRDYVKWRGVIFLRFLLTLVDESEKIRSLADFLFGNILKAKAPLLAYNSFVEAIFVLNDCNAHTGHNNSRSESKLFSISGNDEKSRSQRMHIYTSLLKQMAPEHLLATFAKVCAEILASASDGMLKIEDTAGLSVLQDAFQILSCKEIKLPSNRGVSSDSGEMDGEGGDSGGVAASARGRAVTQAVKKNLIQNTIPIFIELKRLLESKNSPLIGSLMECLRSILKEYKTEIDDMLVADKQLQKELTYDLQKYETIKDKSTAGDAVATMEKSDILRSPGDPKITGSAMRKKLTENQKTNPNVASAVANVVAEATAKSVLKEVNEGILTSPVGSMTAPKVRPSMKKSAVIESVRKKHSFDSDDDE